MNHEPDRGASQTLPLEIAQIVWLHALTLDPGGEPNDEMALVHLAGNDRSVLEHALSHGRGREHDSGHGHVTTGIRYIESAIALLSTTRS